ncbi:hypothetical protein [Geobacter grbiciae]|uniref:hypothetical protein n=1 Tax=Geobacter grbiciae TaxID=155042 RepID=UPI001C025C17|nr:hypothetical protein [Geobacter grbiciae]MBT1076860.1 hypothetical protein [Geobacter grbiciae]
MSDSATDVESLSGLHVGAFFATGSREGRSSRGEAIPAKNHLRHERRESPGNSCSRATKTGW